MNKIILLYLGTTGAGPAYAYEMAKALSSKSNVIAIVSSYSENINTWRKEHSLNSNLKIFEVKTFHGKIEFVNSLFHKGIFKKIADVIKLEKPDFIYTPMNHFWHKRILKYTKDIQSIHTIHDVVLHKGENGLLNRLLNYCFAVKGNGYVVLNEDYKELVAKKYQVDKRYVECIPHACFKSYGTPSSLDLHQYNRILFFGRIIKYKGIDILINSFNKIKNKDIQLLIAGNGDFEEYKEKCASNQNIETKIGWIKDEEVKDLFKNIDVVVLPYISASQSGVIPLAYSFGKPVIVTDIGALATQVVKNKTGLVIPVNDTEALSNAIDSIFSDSDNLRIMKDYSFKYSNDNSWDKSADKLLSFFNRGLK